MLFLFVPRQYIQSTEKLQSREHESAEFVVQK